MLEYSSEFADLGRPNGIRIAKFCQSQSLDTDDKDDERDWMKEMNSWLGRQRRLQHEIDEIIDDMEEPPLPDQEQDEDGEWQDIEYY